MFLEEAIKDIAFKEDLERGIETYKGVKNTEGFKYKNAFDTLIERGDFNVEFVIKEVLLILDEVSKEEESIRNAISFLVVNAIKHVFRVEDDLNLKAK